MSKWEYKVVPVKAKRNFWTSQFDVKAIEEKLNFMGQQGWELVRIDGLHFLFNIALLNFVWQHICNAKNERKINVT